MVTKQNVDVTLSWIRHALDHICVALSNYWQYMFLHQQNYKKRSLEEQMQTFIGTFCLAF